MRPNAECYVWLVNGSGYGKTSDLFLILDKTSDLESTVLTQILCQYFIIEKSSKCVEKRQSKNLDRKFRRSSAAEKTSHFDVYSVVHSI